MLLEVCVDSLESAVNAITSGADELEVCSCLDRGGLTPSVKLVKGIRNMMDFHVAGPKNEKRCKLNVMIRCRDGWDFCYNDEEIAKMLDELTELKSLKIDRFVFGGLTATSEVDSSNCEKIIAKAFPLPVTFHRAFDQTKDPFKAMEEIIRLGFSRVLTSGQSDSAASIEAVQLIKNLINSYGNKIQIMPGAGITLSNVEVLKDVGCKIIHGSFRSETLTRTDKMYVTDGQTVQRVKNILNTTATTS